MSVTLKSGETIKFDSDLFKRSLSYDLTVSSIDLNYVTQFSHAYCLKSGLPQLNQWLRELQIKEHAPPCKDFDLSVGPGSQDLLTKVSNDNSCFDGIKFNHLI